MHSECGCICRVALGEGSLIREEYCIDIEHFCQNMMCKVKGMFLCCVSVHQALFYLQMLHGYDALYSNMV